MATPTQTILNRLQTLLSTDTGTIASATLGVKVHLAIAAFTPGPGVTLASFTEATFTGYAALVAGTGNQQAFKDEVTGNLIVQINEPAGGWHWQASAATGLPQTIFGWYVTDNGVTTVYASSLITPNVLLSASGDGVDVANVRFGVVPGALV